MNTSIVAGSLESWEYLDSYRDLMDWIRADGVTDADSVAAAQHYVNYGYNEGRVITFNAWEYLASNADLMNWLRADGVTDADAISAAQHYVRYGYNEARTLTFDAWEYLASNVDLMDWLAADGVTDADAVAAAKHYIVFGYNEGRTIIFDSATYLAANADVRDWIYNTLGLSGDAANDAAAKHYITYGRHENRMGTPVESYVLQTIPADIKSAAHFTSNPVGTVNTLQDFDKLTGLGDDATLIASLVNPNAHAGYIIAPELNNIKNLEVEFRATTYLSGLDLLNSDQVLTNVDVTGVGSGGFIIENLYAGATNLSVSDTLGLPDLTFTYLNHELAGIQTVALTLTNVYADVLTLGSNSHIPSEQIEHINLVSNGDPTINLVDLLPTGLSVTDQELTITANGDLLIGEDWDGSGNYIEHNNAFTLASVASLASITVTSTGSGDVTLASVGSFTGFTLEASAAKGKIAVNISNAAADATATFKTGVNNDTVLVDHLFGQFVGSGVGSVASGLVDIDIIFAGNLDTGSGDDSVTAHDLAAGTLASGYAGAVITTGAGNDVVTVEKLLGSTGATVGHDFAGAFINVGEGNNSVNADSLQTEARIFAGSGTDVLNLTEAHAGALYTVIAGDDSVDADLNGAEVTLGAGDDTLNIWLTGTGLLDAGSGTVLITGYVDGGSGSDTLSITGNKRGYTNGTLEVVDGNSGHDVSGTGVAYAHAIVGVETLNLTSSTAYSSGYVTTFNAAGVRVLTANDNDTSTADYALNRAEFDNNDTVAGSLTINLIHEAGAIRNIGSGSDIYHGFAGDSASDSLYNLTGTEVITVSALEAQLIAGGTGSGNVSAADTLGTVYAQGAFVADLTLNLSHDSTTLDKVAEITLKDIATLADPGSSPLDPGDNNYDLSINDSVGGGVAYTSLLLTVTGNDNHGVDLNNDFLGNLTVTGSGTTVGGNLTIINIGAAGDTAASTITTSAYNGNVYLGIDSSIDHTITSGIGNDIVRLGDDSAIALGNDSISLGSGNDSVIFNGIKNGANNAGLTIGDTVAGGAGNDLLAFGGATAAGSGVVLDGSGWTHVSGFETIQLSVGQASPVSYLLEITNQLVDDNGSGGSVLHIINNNAGTSGSGIAESNTTLNLTGLNASNEITYEGAIGTGGNGGSDDRFIFNSTNLDGDDTIDGGAADAITVSGVANNDILEILNSDTVTAAADLLNIYNVGHLNFNNSLGSGQTLTLDLTDIIVDTMVDSLHTSSTVAGHSETLYIHANDHSFVSTATAVLHITATSLTGRSNLNILADDSIAGADVILTGGGADSIWGYGGDDSIDGGAGNDSIFGGSGADTILGGAGDDTIHGDAGNDSIIAGEGVDHVFIGTGNDHVSLTETTPVADTLYWSNAFLAGSAHAATVDGFVFGAGADVIDIGVDLSNGVTAATSALVALTPVTVGVNGTATANDVIFIYTEAMALSTVGTAVANAVTVLANGTDFSSANIIAGDSLILQLNDGINTFVFHYVADGTPATTTVADLSLIGMFNTTTTAALVGDFI